MIPNDLQEFSECYVRVEKLVFNARKGVLEMIRKLFHEWKESKPVEELHTLLISFSKNQLKYLPNMTENYELTESLQTQLNSLFTLHEKYSSKIQQEYENVKSGHASLLNKYFDGKFKDFEDFRSILDTLKENRKKMLEESGENLELERQLCNHTKYLHSSFFCMDWIKRLPFAPTYLDVLVWRSYKIKRAQIDKAKTESTETKVVDENKYSGGDVERKALSKALIDGSNSTSKKRGREEEEENQSKKSRNLCFSSYLFNQFYIL